MSDIAMLFTTEMMRANLADIKTQTRRLRGLKQVNSNPDLWHLWQPRISIETGEWAFTTNPIQGEKGAVMRVRCPYGTPGRKMWAREALYEDTEGFWRYRADDVMVRCDRANESQMISWVHHKESSSCVSMHMPRWACRFERTITRIRCERLHEITEADAMAEGVHLEVVFHDATRTAGIHKTAREGYAWLWDEINPEMPWARNPYVWVVEYGQVPA